MHTMQFSIIIPVFNRPDEVDELLASLTSQSDKDFEVIVVEDGSSVPCRDVVERYASQLTIQYLEKENGGPGQARNFGAAHAKGDYYVVLDSDCVLPPQYVAALKAELQDNPCDAFGGPDRAHPDFTPTQKAINYAMTSFLTTGGIRGGKRKLDKFYPRSFNMGMRAELWQKLDGFARMRFGEDIDLSIRIFKSGASCRLFPEAWVWHKRRTDLKKFFKQVHNSGIARINLYKKYPESLKLVHMLPAAFTLSCLLVVPPVLLSVAVFIDSLCQTRDLKVAALAVPASLCQLTGYGSGFLRAWWRRCVMGKDEFEAFKKNFYK